MLTIDSDASGVSVAGVEGRLDSGTAREFGAELAELINAGSTRLVVDLSRVVYISSAGFRALLMAAKLVEDAAGRLVLCGLSPEMQRLFDLGAFTDLFTICSSRQEGIAQAA